MTTYLGKSCSFGLPRVPFRKLPSIYVFSYFPFGFEGRMWDLIVSVPDHCLSFYFFFITRQLLLNGQPYLIKWLTIKLKAGKWYLA